MTEDLLCATVSVRGVIPDTDGRVLTVQRSADHGWELPGGRLSREEPPRQGLRREIGEETGLNVAIADVVKANSWVNTAGEGRFAVHYRCEPTTESVTLSDEHIDHAWVRLVDAEQLLNDAQLSAVRSALTALDTTPDTTDTSSPTPD